ncbi:hypothetical protein ACFE04_005941 [Oxalis oulophora]
MYFDIPIVSQEQWCLKNKSRTMVPEGYSLESVWHSYCFMRTVVPEKSNEEQWWLREKIKELFGIPIFGIPIVSREQWCFKDKNVVQFDIPIVSQEQWCLRDKDEVQFGISIVSREQWCLRKKKWCTLAFLFFKENNGALRFGIPIVSREQWFFKDKNEVQFDIPIVSQEQWFLIDKNEFGIPIASREQWCFKDKSVVQFDIPNGALEIKIRCSLAFLLFHENNGALEIKMWYSLAFLLFKENNGALRFGIPIVSREQWCLKDKNVVQFGIPIVSQEQWCLIKKCGVVWQGKNEVQFGIPIVSREQWCLRNKLRISLAFLWFHENNGASLAFLLFHENNGEQWCLRNEGEQWCLKNENEVQFSIPIVLREPWCLKDTIEDKFDRIRWGNLDPVSQGCKCYEFDILISIFDIPIVSGEQWCLRNENEVQFSVPIVLREQWFLKDTIEDKFDRIRWRNLDPVSQGCKDCLYFHLWMMMVDVNFTEEARQFSGLHILGDGNITVAKCLDEQMSLIMEESYKQWLASVEGFRDDVMGTIGRVKWFPPQLLLFFLHLVVFIPFSTWLVEDLLPESYRDNASNYEKGTHTMDVWLNSGSSWAAVLVQRPGLSFPAGLYLEGTDQHRGWFQSSLLTCVATKGTALYASVVIHGFVLDEKGSSWAAVLGQSDLVSPQTCILTVQITIVGFKMSKYVGNVVDPRTVIEGGKNSKEAPGYGADADYAVSYNELSVIGSTCTISA